MNNEKLVYKSYEVDSLNDCAFTGYASVFDLCDLDGDIIQPGAFAGSIANEKKFTILWQHSQSQPIGITNNIYEDVKGLYIEGVLLNELPKTQEVLRMMKYGVVKAMSIGFRIEDYYWGQDARYITKAKLMEVSLVMFPSNSMALIDSMHSIPAKHMVGDTGFEPVTSTMST